MNINRRRIQRVMSLMETQRLSPEMIRQLRAQGVLPAIAGGSTGAPADRDDDSGGEGGGKPPSDANADSDDEDDDAADDDETDDDDEVDSTSRSRGKSKRTKSKNGDEAEDGYVRLPRSEMQRLRRESREARKAMQQMQSEDRTRREKDMADQEKWKDLAESRDERISELEGELEALRMEGTKNERKANVIKVAKRLNFEYPEDAHRFIDVEDMEDERTIESSLKDVLRDRPKLKSRRKGSGAPIPGEGDEDGKGGALTFEDIQKMSPEDINKRWNEVQSVLRSREVAAS